MACGNCGKNAAAKMCGRCRAPYCGKECQSENWNKHKFMCNPPEVQIKEPKVLTQYPCSTCWICCHPIVHPTHLEHNVTMFFYKTVHFVEEVQHLYTCGLRGCTAMGFFFFDKETKQPVKMALGHSPDPSELLRWFKRAIAEDPAVIVVIKTPGDFEKMEEVWTLIPKLNKDFFQAESNATILPYSECCSYRDPVEDMALKINSTGAYYAASPYVWTKVAPF